MGTLFNAEVYWFIVQEFFGYRDFIEHLSGAEQ